MNFPQWRCTPVARRVPMLRSPIWLRGLFAGVGLAMVFALAPAARATNHQLRMDQIMAGLNGDASVQFIQIVVSDNSQKDWGPQGAETESRAMLVFFDGNGNQTAVFKFPEDPPPGANTVLIATAGFTNAMGLRADMIIPPLLTPGSGKVCFKSNPANPNRFFVNLCLSYGNFPPALTEGAGTPAPELPISGNPIAMVRFQNFGFGGSTSRNGDFRLGSPRAVNTSGQSFGFAGPGPEIGASPASVNFGSQAVVLGPTAPPHDHHWQYWRGESAGHQQYHSCGPARRPVPCRWWWHARHAWTWNKPGHQH